MNHIKRMQAETAAHKVTMAAAKTSIDNFLALLNSDKFTGTEADGSRKDWISTGDVIRWLQEFRSELE
jgi:hypothetical protein